MEREDPAMVKEEKEVREVTSAEMEREDPAMVKEQKEAREVTSAETVKEDLTIVSERMMDFVDQENPLQEKMRSRRKKAKHPIVP